MTEEPDRDFFLLTAIEWAALRAELPPDTRAYVIATVVSREAAHCHLLFQAGKTAEVLARLRTLCRDLLGVHLVDVPAPVPDAARTLGTAADLLHRMRLAADLRSRPLATPCSCPRSAGGWCSSTAGTSRGG
jgi:hypothetical protein